jgi:serine/threonine-protein phosphatase PGAM5
LLKMAGVGALLCRVFGATSGVTAAVFIAGYSEEKESKISFLKNSFQLNAECETESRNSTKWDFNWDARNPDVTDSLNCKASRNIILIRHGQYNLEGEQDKDRYLTELGLEQSQITGLRLAEMALPYTSITVSRMKRAVQTANLIQQYLPEVPLLPEDMILNEGSPIPAEPRGSWHSEAQFNVDGARIEAAFRKYFHRAEASQNEDSYEIVVCHANVIRYFLCRALQLPPERWLNFSLRHASMTWVVIRPDGKVHCRGIGESGHFPADKLSVS